MLFFLGEGANDSIPIPGQNCVLGSSSFLLDGSPVTSPSWESVNQELRWFFLLHTYAFACFFFVLSFYTFFSLLNLRQVYIIVSREYITTPRAMNIYNLCIYIHIFRSDYLQIFNLDSSPHVHDKH